MHKTTLALAALLVLATGCTHALPPQDAASGASSHPTTARKTVDPVTDTADAVAAPQDSRLMKKGDFVTFRFSGTFRKTPVTLTQRVVDVQGSFVTIDVTLKDGARERTLRARFNRAGGSSELVSVSRPEGGFEMPVNNDAYDSMMAETILAADQNEEMVGEETTDVAVGDKSIPCTRTTYRVRVGKSKATMSTLSSDTFAWGDVGGDITRDDGKVLYRVEMIEFGNDTTSTRQVAEAKP